MLYCKSERSAAAVKVVDDLCPAACLRCFICKLFSLFRVDLEERSGLDPEGSSAEDLIVVINTFDHDSQA